MGAPLVVTPITPIGTALKELDSFDGLAGVTMYW
jgi:hypothetical protein